LHLLEVIACSLDDALAAEAGGADRLEICSRLDLSGLTPARELVASIVQMVRIPVRVMIRAEDSFLFVGREQAQVAEMADLDIEGVVCGFLDSAGSLDFASLDRVLQHAPARWKLTLHRCFDAAAGQPDEKFAAVHRHGRADRILSGGPPGVLAGLADERLQFIAGGGLTLENLPQWVRESECREFHVGRAARTPAETTAAVDAAKVRELRDLLSECAGSGGPGPPSHNVSD
jgi:copper homeostasis protein